MRPGRYCIRLSRVLISAVSPASSTAPARTAATGVSVYRARPPAGGQRLLPARRQRPPVGRHPRFPDPPGPLAAASPRLDQLRRRQPHLLPAGPFFGSEPTAIG